MDEEHSVHDVAALLKEFLRDMPEPLLTRELYTAFINTVCEERTCISHQTNNIILFSVTFPDVSLTSNVVAFFPAALARADQEHALQLLIFLLPPCNSDTLQRLLHMLSMVAAHADDSVNCEGQKVTEECCDTNLHSVVCCLFETFIRVL